MFKRSGALSSTRRASKKPSPLPKRGTKKEAAASEKGADKALGKKNALPQPTEQGDKNCENEVSLESVVEIVSPELDMDQQTNDEKSVVQHAEEAIQYSNVDSVLINKEYISDKRDSTLEETHNSQDFEDVYPEVGQLPLEDNDQRFGKDGEDVDLKLSEDLDVNDTKVVKGVSKDPSSIEEGKLESDLLIDAEDSETFQDLRTKADIVADRNTDESKALEIKPSDTSGLVSGGVISLQYPEDDARSLGSVQLHDSKSEDQKDDKVCIRFEYKNHKEQH